MTHLVGKCPMTRHLPDLAGDRKDNRVNGGSSYDTLEVRISLEWR